MNEGSFFIPLLVVALFAVVGIEAFYLVDCQYRIKLINAREKEAAMSLKVADERASYLEEKITELDVERENLATFISDMRASWHLSNEQITELKAKTTWLENSLVWSGAACRARSKDK